MNNEISISISQFTNESADSQPSEARFYDTQAQGSANWLTPPG